jgi:hypothetical protein
VDPDPHSPKKLDLDPELHEVIADPKRWCSCIFIVYLFLEQPVSDSKSKGNQQLGSKAKRKRISDEGSSKQQFGAENRQLAAKDSSSCSSGKRQRVVVQYSEGLDIVLNVGRSRGGAEQEDDEISSRCSDNSSENPIVLSAPGFFIFLFLHTGCR